MFITHVGEYQDNNTWKRILADEVPPAFRFYPEASTTDKKGMIRFGRTPTSASGLAFMHFDALYVVCNIVDDRKAKEYVANVAKRLMSYHPVARGYASVRRSLKMGPIDVVGIKTEDLFSKENKAEIDDVKARIKLGLAGTGIRAAWRHIDRAGNDAFAHAIFASLKRALKATTPVDEHASIDSKTIYIGQGRNKTQAENADLVLHFGFVESGEDEEGQQVTRALRTRLSVPATVLLPSAWIEISQKDGNILEVDTYVEVDEQDGGNQVSEGNKQSTALPEQAPKVDEANASLEQVATPEK